MRLHQLYPDPAKEEATLGHTAKIDIIAVHGLNPRSKKDADHAWDTWRTPKGPKGRLWLRDDLPRTFPESRIFLFEYNSTVVFGKDQGTFVDKANGLLEEIRVERVNTEPRPILLLGYSMGGLLIKQALINAHNNPKYTPIKDATKGLAFFATPHDGGDARLLSRGGLASNIARSLGFQKNGSIFSDLMQEHWKHQLLEYKIVSFWGSKDTTVPRKSSRFNLPGTIESFVQLEGNHSEVCKFGLDDKGRHNLKLVRDYIRELHDAALEEYHPQSEKDQPILRWLTEVDYASQQCYFFNRRQEGTGEWLLGSREFKTWRDNAKQSLFCPGIPGAGKTILTSIVIDHLQTSFRNRNTGIAYIYCSFRPQHEQKTEDHLASLLKQLCKGQSSLPHGVGSLHDTFKRKQTRPSVDELSKNLQSVAFLYSKVFIIVDALDEWQDDQLRDEIKTTISDAVDGMFLLAQPYLKLLKGQATLTAVRSVLKELQRQSPELNMDSKRDVLYKVYNGAMERINQQVPSFQQRAAKALSWITCARRALTTVELLQALAVKPKDIKIDEGSFEKIDKIISVCAGMVTVDEASNIIGLAHYITQEYLERTRNHWLPNAEADIANTCITYLSFSAFENGACRNDDEFDKRLQSHPFYDYAARNWGYHAQAAPALPDCVLNFSRNTRNQMFPTMTELHLTSYFGIEEAVRVLLGIHKPDLKDSCGRTPLSYAAQKGHTAVVTQLLANHVPQPRFIKLFTYDATIDTKDVSNTTPLAYAALNGHTAIIMQLLAKGAAIEIQNDFGRTPLMHAAVRGHQAVLTQLLANGAAIEAKDQWGQTPLIHAARNGQTAVFTELLAKGADAEATDSTGETPLIAAWYRPMDTLTETEFWRIVMGGSDSRLNGASTTFDKLLDKLLLAF
ncbi:uncharacterized protein N7496_010792 [Penicillium cataractarum]|uniref:NACHT domain-containing protein n=1 Tax=Penicillium cataractarum TaxID=2100454 RepID=A0A9W9RFK7_9EURO|nr:uncharacterized protein N7496_010792 [Penicillium cataractarum]KAJ5358379.1 hypothetical protein N7496_010792 [Penicillium cataractarum]